MHRCSYVFVNGALQIFVMMMMMMYTQIGLIAIFCGQLPPVLQIFDAFAQKKLLPVSKRFLASFEGHNITRSECGKIVRLNNEHKCTTDQELWCIHALGELAGSRRTLLHMQLRAAGGRHGLHHGNITSYSYQTSDSSIED